MRGFAQRHAVAASLAWLDAQLKPLVDEIVPLRLAAGRVLATSVVSDVDVPGFDRATMDGYAVVANSTEGATAYTRLPLTVIGDSMPGCPFDGIFCASEAVRIVTGAPMPRGTDAVLPAEWLEVEPHESNPYPIHALAAVSPGKNIGRRGEDIARGTVLAEPGRVLRPQDLGVLSSVGNGEVGVVRRPRVRGMTLDTIARSAGLGFLPVQAEQYDFIVPRSRADRPGVVAFRSLLQQTST
jgi:molybdopterin molybdotransferase